LKLLQQKLIILFATGILLSAFGCDKFKNSTPKTDEEKVSYAIGQQIGQSLKMQGMEPDVSMMAASIKDAVEGKEPKLSQEEMQKAMMSMREKMMAKAEAEAKTNEEKGKKFLEENKAKPNVKTTDSGLQYEVVEEGKGAKPGDKSIVKVHYKGTLVDGSEFDSSYKRNEPAEFPVNGVIPGWTEALKMMKAGSKYKLYIPPELAYGPQGRPGIPPNSVLIFDVELLEVKKK